MENQENNNHFEQNIKELEEQSVSLIKRVFKSYETTRVSERSAMLAFFTLIALVPLLTFLIIGTQVVMGRDFAEDQVVSFVGEVMGDAAPISLRALVHRSASALGSYAVTSIVGGLIILWSMTTVFLYLRKSLTRIFSLEEIEGGLVQRTVTSRLLAVLYMLILFLLVLLIMLAHSYIKSLFTFTDISLGNPFSPMLTAVLGVFLSFLLALGFFSVVYGMVSSRIRRNDALFGGLVAASFFTGITVLFSAVLVSKTVLSLYGELGIFIAFGLYLYYLYTAFFIGALAARHHGIVVRRMETSS